MPTPGSRERDRARAAAEDLATALLAVALAAGGTPARSLSARDVELKGDGPYGAGVLTHLDAHYLRELLADEIVPLVPGGHAVRADGETVMLRAPAADLTAVRLAAALKIPCSLLAYPYGTRSRHHSIHPAVTAQAQALGVSVGRRILDLSPPGAWVEAAKPNVYPPVAIS